MILDLLNKIFGQRYKCKVYKPEFLMEELERRISFDASMGDLLFHDPLPNLADIPHAIPSDHHVVLITDSVAATDGVRQAILKDSQVIVVDSHRDNLKTINEKIAEQVQADGRKIGALAVLAHAEKGKVILGTDKIDLANVQDFKPQLEELGKNFADKGQIQLFGCSVAEDVYGKGLTEVLSVATHTDVFASTNATGHGPEKDWNLEYSTNPTTHMKTAVDAEQLAALPLDLATGDLVITTGTVGPISNPPTLVNLNSAFSVASNDGTKPAFITPVVLLANPPPDYTEGWLRIDVDTTYATSIGVVVTKPNLNQIVLTGGTVAQVSAVLGTLEGTLNDGFNGNAQILMVAQYGDLSSAGAVKTLNIPVGPVAGPIDIHVPTPLTVDPNVTAPVAGVSITDVDAGNTGQVTVTLSAAHGRLTVQVPASTPGLEPATYTNANVTFTDTLINVNTALAGLKYTPSAGYAGAADTITINAVDQNLGSDTQTITVNVNASGGSVVLYPATPHTYQAPVNLTTHIAGLNVTDSAPVPSAPNNQFTVAVAVDHGKLTTMEAQQITTTTQTGVLISDQYKFVAIGPEPQLSFRGPLQYANISLAGLMYTPDPKYDGPDTLYVTVIDPSSNSASASYPINITNATPTIPAHPDVSAAINISTAITGITIGDTDIGTTNMAVTLSAKYGVLNVPGSSTVTGNGTSTLIINDTITNVNIQLSGLRYTGLYTGPDTLTITANDQSYPTDGTATRSVNITVTAAPVPTLSAPVVTVPGAQTVTENSSAAITGMSVYDADIGTTGQLTVTLRVSHGTVSVQVPATTPGTTPTTQIGSTITFTDTLANVNTALAGLIYTPTAKYDSTDTLTITAVDQSPSPLSDTKTVAIIVTNVSPTITAPATATAVTATSSAITGLSLADPDIATTNMSVTLSVGYGTLSLPSSTNVTGNGSKTVMINDTLANVNAQLGGLRYTSNSGFTGTDTLSITANDLSTPTAGTDSDQVLITVTSAPSPPIAAPQPTVTVPSVMSVNEDTAVTIWPISVNYSDPMHELKVTITVNNGTLALGWKGWLNSYEGEGTSKIRFTGALSAITSTFNPPPSNPPNPAYDALYGLRYTPNHNYFDTTDDRLTITVDDQLGHTDTKQVVLNVYSVNDPPVITVPGTQSISVNTPKVIGGVSVADPDVGAGSLKMTLSALHGNLSVTGVGPSADITFTNTLVNVNTLLGTLTYRPVSGYWGPDWITVTANDQGNSGAGGAMSDTKKITVRVGVY